MQHTMLSHALKRRKLLHLPGKDQHGLPSQWLALLRLLSRDCNCQQVADTEKNGKQIKSVGTGFVEVFQLPLVLPTQKHQNRHIDRTSNLLHGPACHALSVGHAQFRGDHTNYNFWGGDAASTDMHNPPSKPQAASELQEAGSGDANFPESGERSNGSCWEASLLAASGVQVCSTSESSWGPVDSVVQAIDGLHQALGLPWWLTLALTAAGVRTALLPLSIQQIKSAAANIPLFQLALKRSATEETKKVSAPRLQVVKTEYEALRRQSQAPSPLWIIAGPLIQLPVFVTAVMAVRRMAGAPCPGLDSGGIFWFTDLTLPAVQWGDALLAAPMGTPGIILPACVTLLMFANLQTAFASPAPGPGERSAVTAFLVGYLKLGLEWLTVGILLVGMQLPHAVLVYWASSSALALTQAKILRMQQVREALGLGVPPMKPQMTSSQSASPPPLTPAATAQIPESQLQDVFGELENKPIDAIFQQAAEWRAKGDLKSTVAALDLITRKDDKNSRAWFALGQTLMSMKLSERAHKAYTKAAELEEDPQVRARAYLGSGISASQQGTAEAALHALGLAVKYAQLSLEAAGPREPVDDSSSSKGRLASDSSSSGPAREEAALMRATAGRALLAQASIFVSQGDKVRATQAVEEAIQYDSNAKRFLAELRKP